MPRVSQEVLDALDIVIRGLGQDVTDKCSLCTATLTEQSAKISAQTGAPVGTVCNAIAKEVSKNNLGKKPVTGKQLKDRVGKHQKAITGKSGNKKSGIVEKVDNKTVTKDEHDELIRKLWFREEQKSETGDDLGHIMSKLTKLHNLNDVSLILTNPGLVPFMMREPECFEMNKKQMQEAFYEISKLGLPVAMPTMISAILMILQNHEKVQKDILNFMKSYKNQCQK